jgi:Ca-activated chloride channel family protein
MPFDPRATISAAAERRDTPGAANPYQTRLALAKQVVSRFAGHRVAEGDRVGLVVFGSTAFTQCPLTSDGALLSSALERVDVGIAGEATALGDALALAVKRAPKSDTAAGRVVVLLTDGRSNAGSIPIEVASALAAGDNLRVHTVGIGTGGEEVAVAMRSARGEQRLRFERHDTDPETLRQIARVTGGRYFSATRSSDLRAVYREIDDFERVERPLPPRIQQTLHAEPLLATAGALVVMEILLASILRRRVP